MKLPQFLRVSPLLLAACSASPDATQEPAVTAQGSPFSGDGVEVVATVEIDAHTVYFYEVAGVGLGVAGHSPPGAEPMFDSELMNLEPVELYKKLRPGQPVPQKLLEAELRVAELEQAARGNAEFSLEETQQQEMDGAVMAPAPTDQLAELDGASGHGGDYFYRYYCYRGSQTWCETDQTTGRRIWLGSHSHKSAMYVDVVAGTFQAVWWDRSHTNWTATLGLGHWWWNFHNGDHSWNYAWDRDHGWGVEPHANSRFHWTGWYCGNDCFVATNNFF